MAAFVATNWERSVVGRWRPMSVLAAAANRPPLVAAVEQAPPPPEEPEAGGAAVDLEGALAATMEALEAERRAHEQTKAQLASTAGQLALATDSVEVEAARLRAAVEGLGATRRRLVDEIREGVGQLVLASARKLAGEGLRVQPGLVEALVVDTVAALGREGLVVRVSPDDVSRVTRALDGTGAQVVADNTIEGGCAAATPFGSVDATLQTATAALRVVVEHWQSAGWRSDENP